MTKANANALSAIRVTCHGAPPDSDDTYELVSCADSGLKNSGKTDQLRKAEETVQACAALAGGARVDPIMLGTERRAYLFSRCSWSKDFDSREEVRVVLRRLGAPL